MLYAARSDLVTRTIQIENEQNAHILRQVALLRDRENRHLHERIKALIVRNAPLEGSDDRSLQLEIDQLRETLAKREQEIFGVSSEKRHTPRTPKPDSAPQTGHGPTEQPQLPVVEETLELAEEERVCPSCEGTLEPLDDQTEDTEEITVVQRRFTIVKRRRQKYRCRCNAAAVTAPASPTLAPGGRYSSAFAVEVAINKYLNHEPLERQSRTMACQGLVIGSQTLWDQIEALAGVLRPSYEVLHPRFLGC